MTDVVTVTQVISEILVEFSVYTWVGIYCGRYTGVYYLGTISLDSKWTMESPRMTIALSRRVRHARRRKSSPRRALYTRSPLQAYQCLKKTWRRLPRLVLSQKILRNRWWLISIQRRPPRRRRSSCPQKTPATAATLEAWSPSSIAK